MSWLRSAVHRAVEVGGNSNLTRTVRNVADSVVQQAGQAVAGGAKLLQDRIGARNFQNFKLAVKRLEEVSVSCRGVERVQLLRRWLVALKEIERLNEAINSEQENPDSVDSTPRPTVVLYYDPDHNGEPMNFHDVFLHSQALEGITLSMILQEPNEEEISLLLEIFGLCLLGGKDVHSLTANSIQELAKAFSIYTDEILAKREELLRYAQDAIAGLKVNAEIVRIDSEVSAIHKRLDEMVIPLPTSEDDNIPSEVAVIKPAESETLKKVLEHVQLCSRLEELLLRKKFLEAGDSADAYAQKVDKLKVLMESLASSATKAQKRISDHRLQKEEALHFRVSKANEVSQLEKDLAAEIQALEKRKDELEAELKKVNVSLASTNARLHNAREEREQFDEANNEILQHFKQKEEELSKSVASYRSEAEVCNTFISFLEDTWVFQSSYSEQKEKQVNDELKRYEEYFVDLAVYLLTAYKEELRPLVSTVRELVQNLKRSEIAVCTNDEKGDTTNSRRSLEEQFQALESKFLTTFSIVETIKRQFYAQEEGILRKSDARVKELFDSLGEIKKEFESIERPTLEIETAMMKPETPPRVKTPRISFLSPRPLTKDELGEELSPDIEAQSGEIIQSAPRLRPTESFKLNRRRAADPEAQLSKLKLELELESRCKDLPIEDISDWEYDDIAKEPTRIR